MRATAALTETMPVQNIAAVSVGDKVVQYLAYREDSWFLHPGYLGPFDVASTSLFAA